MMRRFSGWTVLLLLAILFVVGLIWVRKQPQELEDPLADAQHELHEKLGFLIEEMPGPKGGLTVKEVTPDSPAVQMRLEVGDRILAVNERSVWHARQLQDLLAEKLQRGPTVLMVERQGEYRSLLVSARAVPGAGALASPSGHHH